MRLVIRTSSGGFGLGLLAPGGALLASRMAGGRSARSVAVGDLLADLLAATALRPDAITALCVDLGPGGMSATRAGVSFANAFAHARQIPLFGASALELQMLSARKTIAAPLLSLRPCPGGLVFWQVFQGVVAVDRGQGPLIEARAAGLAHGARAVAGPLEMIRKPPGFDMGLTLVPADPPDLDCFAEAALRPAPRIGGLALLEPITSLAQLDDPGPLHCTPSPDPVP